MHLGIRPHLVCPWALQVKLAELIIGSRGLVFGRIIVKQMSITKNSSFLTFSLCHCLFTPHVFTFQLSKLMVTCIDLHTHIFF